MPTVIHCNIVSTLTCNATEVKTNDSPTKLLEELSLVHAIDMLHDSVATLHCEKTTVSVTYVESRGFGLQ